jgi:hypothetical protein
MSLFTVMGIIVFILVVGPILFWVVRGLAGRSVAAGEERERDPSKEPVFGMALMRFSRYRN